jgi:Zn-dependent protease with chaperone function
MYAFDWIPIAWLATFIVLLLISIYSLKQTFSLRWITLFLVISYIQAVIFVFAFKFVSLPLSVMFGVFYFLLIPAIIKIHNIYSKKSTEKFEEFSNNELRDRLATIWNLSVEEIKLIIFDDGDCPNAYREVKNGKLLIYVGKNLMKILNKDQLLFVLSHEVAHFKNKSSILVYCLSCFIYIIFLWFINQIVPAAILLNQIFFIVLTFILFIIGVMGSNFLRWRDEYSADYYGGLMINDIRTVESFFHVDNIYQKDHGLLVDLIYFDHPSNERRIKNLQKLKGRN